MESGALKLRGAALVCAAALCWSLGGLFVRLIGSDLDGWTIAFWRSAFMVLAVGGWLVAADGFKALAVYRAMGWAGVRVGPAAGGLVRAVHPGDHAHDGGQCRGAAERGAAGLCGAGARVPEGDAGAGDSRRHSRWRCRSGADVCRRARRRRSRRQRAGARRCDPVRRQYRGGAGGARARPGAGDGAGGTVRASCHAAAGECRCADGLRSGAARPDGLGCSWGSGCSCSCAVRPI